MVSRQLFGIPATQAPIVAVIGRGPSEWASVGRWDVDAMTYEAGARLHARIYPQRCDLSPDGQYLCYFTLNYGSDWAAGDTYEAVSRLPWLFALAAWSEHGTWSRGMVALSTRRRTTYLRQQSVLLMRFPLVSRIRARAVLRSSGDEGGENQNQLHLAPPTMFGMSVVVHRL